jgi:protein TonB
MSKSNIYESTWTNLVFENKNKEYGAYQLRQENSKTTITALFMGLLLLAGVTSVPLLINMLRKPAIVETTPPPFDPQVVVVNVDPTVVPPPPAPPAPPVQQTTAPVTDVSQLTHPVVVTTDQAVDNIAKNTENGAVVDNATPGTGTIENVVPGNGGTGDSVAPPAVDPNTPVIAAVLDKLPEFPGGMNKFYTYVGNNFNRPELESEKVLKVYVSFVIERDGSITDIMVKNDPGYGMGKEAIRVLKSLKTKWIPGVLNGKAVRTAYNLPITIKTEME